MVDICSQGPCEEWEEDEHAGRSRGRSGVGLDFLVDLFKDEISVLDRPSIMASLDHLESLVAFYQTEQMWILQAKAILDLESVTPQVILPKQEEPVYNFHPSKPLWARRRNTAKLRLANLSSQNRPGRRARSAENMLRLFSNLVDSRIESCQRVAHMLVAADRRRRSLSNK